MVVAAEEIAISGLMGIAVEIVSRYDHYAVIVSVSFKQVLTKRKEALIRQTIILENDPFFLVLKKPI
jgi:hypothetical protein